MCEANKIPTKNSHIYEVARFPYKSDENTILLSVSLRSNKVVSTFYAKKVADNFTNLVSKNRLLDLIYGYLPYIIVDIDELPYGQFMAYANYFTDIKTVTNTIAFNEPRENLFYNTIYTFCV